MIELAVLAFQPLSSMSAFQEKTKCQLFSPLSSFFQLFWLLLQVNCFFLHAFLRFCGLRKPNLPKN